MLILAIESSCDETSAAVLDGSRVLSLCTETQSIHSHYGGVVPELAGRSHLDIVPALVAQAMVNSGVSYSNLNLIAATRGPGLIGSLLVGVNFARGLSIALQIPFHGIHHIEAHLWSAEIGSEGLEYPFLALVASGGHTLLAMVRGLRNYEVLGSTLDDAIGEAFDKVGKLGGLAFPAGAALDKLASTGDPTRYPFNVPMSDTSLDFSFSGLKTAFIKERGKLASSDLAASERDLFAGFQFAAVESVARKVERALRDIHPRAIVCAGGVAANSQLRKRLAAIAEDHRIAFKVPPLSLCQDNAAMIGYLAHKLESSGIHDDNDTVVPRWPLANVQSASPLE